MSDHDENPSDLTPDEIDDRLADVATVADAIAFLRNDPQAFVTLALTNGLLLTVATDHIILTKRGAWLRNPHVINLGTNITVSADPQSLLFVNLTHVTALWPTSHFPTKTDT